MVDRKEVVYIYIKKHFHQIKLAIGSFIESISQFLQKNQLLVMIIFLSFMIRYYLMGWISYWYDELLSVVVRGINLESGLAVLNYHREAGSSTPLYEFILYNWMQMFGHSEVATRSLSTLYVSLATVFLYLLAKRLFGRRVAIASALFFTFSYMAMLHSLEARYYGQTLFLCTFSSYILLKYAESLKSVFSWKNMLLNKYYFVLLVLNVALMLTHLTNYLFILAQFIFMIFYFLYRNSSENIAFNIFKAGLLYVLQVTIMSIVWNFSVLKKILGIVNNLDVSMLSIMFGFVILIAFLYVIQYLNKRKLSHILLWQKILFLFLIIGFASITLYISQGKIFLDIVIVLLIDASYLFMSAVASPNFDLAVTTYLIFITIILYIIVKNIIPLFSKPGSGFTDRKIFFIYVLAWLLLPSFLMQIIVLFGLEHFTGISIIRPRYLIVSTPPLMLTLALIIDQGFKLFDYFLRRLTRVSLRKHYIKFSTIYMIVALILFVIPASYPAATTHKHAGHDWHGIAKQIINLVRENPENRYIIYETSPRPVPLLDYYLSRYSDDIRVHGMIRRHEERAMASDDNYVARFEKDEESISSDSNDYIIVVFTHERFTSYPKVTERLSELYNLHYKQIDRDAENRGFVVYKIDD